MPFFLIPKITRGDFNVRCWLNMKTYSENIPFGSKKHMPNKDFTSGVA